ncbi:DNA-binding response regulator [Agrococcus sp. ARC_14]|uniref:helix-turn-helix transcriptional regulator n=1 Tax=Agrococcus sp. ARC_14 TaxID=2919927 RepID=UPI001F065AD1|nr:DNA-binding response regulator [Agrococcus sp. ARC_14]MCH1882223.1 DNA-binding response regulator [Agrococcus sp. ARC_14]
MTLTDTEVDAPRSVSIVATGTLSAALREAIDADPGLRLSAVAPRFTDLVVDAGFPGDVVVLAEEPGRALLAHAVTAVAAGALVVVHADVDDELRDRLEDSGAVVVPLAASVAAVVARSATARHTRRRGPRVVTEEAQRRPRLSPGERRALAHYVQGLTTVQVAAAMGVGYETAKTFLRRVRAKYTAVDRSAGKRAQLILRAEEDGIL